MAEQVYCSECTSRRFFIMLQDDGSITAFCDTGNHPRVLVNVPELVRNILHPDQGELFNAGRNELDTGGNVHIFAVEEKQAEVQSSTEADTTIS